MKNLFKTIAYGAAGAFGYLTGVRLFNKLVAPGTKAKIKRKFIRVKNAILEKEES